MKKVFVETRVQSSPHFGRIFDFAIRNAATGKLLTTAGCFTSRMRATSTAHRLATRKGWTVVTKKEAVRSHA